MIFITRNDFGGSKKQFNKLNSAMEDMKETTKDIGEGLFK